MASAVPIALAAGLLPYLKQDEKPALTLMGFEVVASVAGVLGVRWSRAGRNDEGPALGLACIAGTILIASALGWQGASRNLAGHSLTPLLAFRALASLSMLALAAGLVLVRERRAWLLAIRGVLLLLPVVVLAGSVLYAPARDLLTRLASGTVGFALALLAFLLAAVLLAIGGHCIIRAFELGRPGPKTKA